MDDKEMLYLLNLVTIKLLEYSKIDRKGYGGVSGTASKTVKQLEKMRYIILLYLESTDAPAHRP